VVKWLDCTTEPNGHWCDRLGLSPAVGGYLRMLTARGQQLVVGEQHQPSRHCSGAGMGSSLDYLLVEVDSVADDNAGGRAW
jgi:hypothetical protein